MKTFNFVNKNVQYFTFFNLIIISLLFQINTDNSNNLNAAIIQMKTFYPKDYKETDPIKQLVNSFNFRKIYLDIEVKSGQKMSTFLNYDEGRMHTSNQIAFFRTDLEKDIELYTKNCEQICTYNYQRSASYKSYTDFNINFYGFLARKASEQMIFYKDLEAKDKSTHEMNFLHVSNDTHSCLLAGNFNSKSQADKDYNLFLQVKELINSQKYTWSLYFNNKDEGKFIIGDIIDNDKFTFYNNNTKDNYIQITQSEPLGKIFWKIKFENIFIGNYTKEIKKEFFIDLNSRYISVDENYFDEIKKQYMFDDNVCQKVINIYKINNRNAKIYTTIYCDKNKYLQLTDNYKKLNNLTLRVETIRVNITFTPQELFFEKDNNLYFLIRVDRLFTYDEEEDIYEDKNSIGTILLEKYVTVFDDDAKCLYILRPKDMPIIPPKDYTTLKIVLISVFSFILCAIIFIILGKVYGKKLFARKRKANELEDTFDYTPENVKDENDSNKNLLIDNEENVQNNENGAINNV